MKVLIVDDEQHVREAVKLLVDWSEFGIGTVLEAENGETAARRIERERPDIVITDMKMPVRDGCDLLRWMQENGHAARRIVISGHDDFELVRSTMKYGGQDYLLKPIDQEELGSALRKAVDDLRREERTRLLTQKQRMEMNRLRPVYWDRMFSDLATEPGALAAASDMLREEFGLAPGSRCRVAVVDAGSAVPAVLEKYRRNRDLLFFSIANVCNEFLRPDNRGFACRNWNREDELLIFCWSRPDELRETLVNMNEGLQLVLGSRFDFGIGQTAVLPEGAGASYRSARASLRQRNLLKKRARYFETGAAGGSKIPTAGAPMAAEFEESFRIALLSQNEAEMRSAAGEWIRAVSGLEAVTQEQLELWRQQFEAMRLRWKLELPGAGPASEPGVPGTMPAEEEAAAPFPAPFDAAGCLSLPAWERQLGDWLLSLSSTCGVERPKEKNAMREIAKYIESNYNRELTLQEIAGHFYLSREYISRKFKQEFGENLSDFLGRVRIGKAKRLLLNPRLRIAEVANMVGYADEKYFSKVFKKLEGISPGQYRKG